ncbi:FAD-binding oxidoreductase [Allobranchiibius huperziae]|uniref:Alkyldihydroxyacetonephosphate synthase n=1 Tax=Allobranchiibius huperziae TaxID=1874116 RepID=A0A853DE91_9MICO|nr:FAD-binding oxidoreductase [Allobranchiibius huperziae]NYJ73384.1 alkyldihydroxyacetonephosphate synthase [Allobranchiibius huperziae]
MSDRMHWSRWGDPARTTTLPANALAMLELAFGPPAPRPAVDQQTVQLPAVGLPDDVLDALRDAIGVEHVDAGVEPRLLHTGGKSTPDLLALRGGDAAAAPDAVLRPADHDEVQALVSFCSERRIAVVPYGGGTSVVGGLTASRDGLVAVVAIDLGRLDRLVDVDEVSSTAVLQAGVSGPRAEELLGEHGMTLGHFPQSFEFATVGGFAATRSSGQSSSGYGRFDTMVVGLKVATPLGTWELGVAPASAAGPDLRQLVLGSEGTLGIVTEVRLAVRTKPATAVYETWRFPTFVDGATAMRTLTQDGINPTVLRLSDETETSLNLAKPESIGADSGGGALMVCGYEGTDGRVERMRREVGEVLQGLGGTPLGAEDGEQWAEGRFDAPYLRDALLDEGVLVETLETATFWGDLDRLYAEVKAALEGALSAQGTNPIVLCHISHVYRTGASLYFTVACRETDDPRAQWYAAKQAASDAIVAAGGTITHHHAVGRDHRPWYAEEIGPIGTDVLRAVKRSVDPAGVLNPGVLIP